MQVNEIMLTRNLLAKRLTSFSR